MYDFDDILQFGIYKGETIEHVLDSDLQYLVWCMENIKNFKVSNEVYKKLEKKVDLTNKMC